MTTATDAVRATELRAEAGITYRQLDHWIRRGFIPGVTRQTTRDGEWSMSDPDRDLDPDTAGSGHWRLFDDAARRRVLTIARLVRCGFTPPAAAAIAPALEQTGEAQLAGLVVTWKDTAS